MADNEWLHNWMYVIIPISKSTMYPSLMVPVLAGYCKNCRQAITVLLDFNAQVISMTDTGIPRTGCVGPEGQST